MIPAIPPRLALALAGVLFAGLALVGAWAKGYAVGKRSADAAVAEARLAVEQARSDALARLAASEQRAARIQADAAARIAAARAAGTASTTTVREVIHAYPEFGGLRRPADLERVRDAQLDAIAAAARRSADLSGGIVSGVRTAGHADRADPGGD
jgi:hypothetical protein